MSPARRLFLPHDPDPAAVPPPASSAMSRRRMMSGALASGVGAALTGVPAAAQEATPLAGEASTIETVSGQALYSLPRDHRWHGGPFYETSEYWEWHYWTGFATAVDTGEEWGLFYTWNESQYATRDAVLD